MSRISEIETIKPPKPADQKEGTEWAPIDTRGYDAFRVENKRYEKGEFWRPRIEEIRETDLNGDPALIRIPDQGFSARRRVAGIVPTGANIRGGKY